MQVGYVRISKSDGLQTLDLQKDELTKIGIPPEKIYEDQTSGKKDNCKGLNSWLKSLGEGDVLVV